MFVSVRKGASLLQYDVPPSCRPVLARWIIEVGAHRAAGVENLHGPGGLNSSYITETSDGLILICGSSRDIRFPWIAASSADSAPAEVEGRISGEDALMTPADRVGPSRVPGRRRSCGSARRIAIIGNAETDPDPDPKES